MKSITLLIVFVILLSTASAKEIISKKTISAEYGTLGDWLGIGDRLYKITYNDNTVEYQIQRATFLKPAFITSIQSSYTLQTGDKVALVSISIKGISSMMDGSSWHDHEIQVSDSNGVVVSTEKFSIYSGSTKDTTIMITPPTTPGTYNYNVQEYIYMATGAVARGDSRTVMIIVGGGSTPTPTPITKFQCSNGAWVTDISLCPTSTPTPTPSPTPSASPTPSSTATASPTSTSGMTLETPTTTKTPSATATPYNTPGFESVFAVIGLVITAYMVLRQKPPKDEV